MFEKKAAIILAAGKGKRMHSSLPKVLHQIGGKSLVRYLIETISTLNLDRISMVVGYKGEMVIQELSDFDIDFVWQKDQLGTGHAVQTARENFGDFDGTILVAAGDVPFLSAGTILELFKIHERNEASATCLSADFDNPEGYGRIIRQPDSDILLDIIEDSDADPETLKIREINTGTFCFNSCDLFYALTKVNNSNSQKEYYLTDTIKILRNAGKTCAVWKAANPVEAKGVNSLEQLLTLEKEFKKS